jgi:hypothetical protein
MTSRRCSAKCLRPPERGSILFVQLLPLIVLVWSAALNAVDALNKGNFQLLNETPTTKRRLVLDPIAPIVYQTGSIPLTIVPKKPLALTSATRVTINFGGLHDINGNLVINAVSGQPTSIDVSPASGSDARILDENPELLASVRWRQSKHACVPVFMPGTQYRIARVVWRVLRPRARRTLGLATIWQQRWPCQPNTAPT